MNTIPALKTSAEKGGPILFGAGLSMLVVALIYPSHGTDTADRRPTPAATATATPAGRTPTPTPSARGSGPRTVEAARRPTARQPDRTAGAGPRQANGQSAGTHEHPRPSPSPAPPTPAEPASCSGHVLAVRLPLGVLLPDCAITIGGTR